jgi:hypothetical protein
MTTEFTFLLSRVEGATEAAELARIQAEGGRELRFVIADLFRHGGILAIEKRAARARSSS